ncbi:hypothetical protein [Vibrio cholerae]|uniref:hypothetical protein n=1 Tax=Vibrio cholerae TaxID=666 RepID=UPI0006E6DC0B|nr:hypothetical protein [Vibrio cholerae]KQA34796.1 hypothetical protein XV74_17720 [Vibrio cholerae]KQA40702.1 hypothetical protein XV75_17900 [Vibrio cholerae]KQA52840.1 hypothetical protein XV79_17750 [Vibrio cholerae]KQA73180.1 hypothetical protein XV84_13435 [Vibrio cholerae]KQA74461.1 hypothetical protein XV85_17780 [Vibrio cholerae]
MTKNYKLRKPDFIIVPDNTKIKPFKTIYSGQREDIDIESWDGHIPLFEDADPNSLYSRFVAMMTRYKLEQYNLSSCSFRLLSETYDDLQAFFLKFKRDIDGSGIIKFKDLFHSGANASNLSIFLKHSAFHTGLILFKLEHDIEEESEE